MNEKFRKIVVETGAEKAVVSIVKGISSILPEPEWEKLENYKPENFFSGNEKFADRAKKGACWRLGFARASLVPDDWLINRYYIAGYLHFPPNVMSGVLDDMAVRVVAVDTNDGRGISVFAVIDCVGISNTDVRRIRSELASFAKENNIVSINVSAIHCHSAIDTQGLWGELPEMLKNNVRAIKNKRPENVISGKNKQFMDMLVERTVNAIKEAVGTMTCGTLSYNITDKLDHNRDKRPPDVMDKDLLTLYFEPDDGSRGTVAMFAAAHPVSLGANNTLLSSDYIYYAEQEVNKGGKNFIFFQGAELAIARNSDFVPEELRDKRDFISYGRGLGNYAVNVPKSEKKKLSPVFNIKLAEMFVPSGSPILTLAGKIAAVNNRVLRTGKGKSDLCFVTEIGYAELGANLALALIPGEMAPEIQLGGAPDKNTSYNHTDWHYRPLNDMVREGRHLTVIGLCNDSVGYIITDNDFGSMFAPLHYEESVSSGKYAGSAVASAFERLTDSVK